jgi:hypothetical protein
MLTDTRWGKLFHLMKSTGRVYDKPEYRKHSKAFFTAVEQVLCRIAPTWSIDVSILSFYRGITSF